VGPEVRKVYQTISVTNFQGGFQRGLDLKIIYLRIIPYKLYKNCVQIPTYVVYKKYATSSMQKGT
jgi:hypothetical protein